MISVTNRTFKNKVAKSLLQIVTLCLSHQKVFNSLKYTLEKCLNTDEKFTEVQVYDNKLK